MKEDLGYVQEKLFEAVICLASGEAGLSGRLDYASDFILRIQERHFPPSNDGDRQLEKFRSIRGRLANGVPAQEAVLTYLLKLFEPFVHLRPLIDTGCPATVAHDLHTGPSCLRFHSTLFPAGPVPPAMSARPLEVVYVAHAPARVSPPEV